MDSNLSSTDVYPESDTNSDAVNGISYNTGFKEWLRNSIEFSNASGMGFNESYKILFDQLLEMFSLESDPQYRQKQVLKNAFVLFFYSLIIFVSLFGNLLVCYIIISKQRLRSRTTNILIFNLTISDLLLTLFNIPITTARLLLDDWPFGSVLCKLGPFIQAMSVYVSTISMTIIAIDRYQVLVGLFRKRFTTSVPTGLIILMIWLLAGLLSIPHAIFNQVVELITLRKLIRCRAVYPSPDGLYRKWITILTFSTQYFIPLLIIIICYSRIGIHIYRRVGIGAMTQQQRTDQNQSKWRTIKMLITVVVVFAICWLPLNIHHIRSDFGLGNYSSNIFLVCHWIAMSSVCYNPFIYFWLNKHYNERAKYLLKYCFSFNCAERQHTSDSTEAQNNYNISNNTTDGRKSRGLKRTNAIKVSKGKLGNRLLGAMCVRSSISTSDSNVQDNNYITVADNNCAVNCNEGNQTIVTAIVDETKV